MDQVIYNGKTYEDETLNDLDCFIGGALAADELAVDTLTAVVRDYDTQWRVVTYRGLPVVTEGRLLVARMSDVPLDKGARYGADVLYRHNGGLVGKFKLEEIKRTGKYEYQLSCLSAIGLLLTSDHYGGIYTGQTAAEVLEDIVGGVVDYTLDEALAAVPVYGLLRKASRRDNLRDLLFAIGGQVRKDTAGELRIIPMAASEPYAITADEFYMGGSVTGGKPATGVNVTEHSFMALPGDAVVTLYDGASSAEELVTPAGKTVTGVLVDFQEPMHGLSIQNAEILESGANYAVISGSPAAVLTGRQYTHTTRIISRRQETGGAPNIVTSSACTLVNLLNSELVADRLMAYYGAAKTVEADIVVTGQKPGDAVTFVDPFGDETTGYIADMELTMSAILKAKCTLVSGYIPGGSGNFYSNVAVITADGEWTVPEGCKGKIRVVLIGGGDGGLMGAAGTDGKAATGSAFGAGGEGGAPGTPGSGGKVYIATVKAEAGQVFSCRIGAGGLGQTAAREATVGGATTFGGLTSADGYSAPEGHVGLINGEVYALPGEEGIPGGKGAGADEGDTITYNGRTYVPGASGADASLGKYWAKGGKGGGAAAGADGGAGEDGTVEDQDSSTFSQGGDGGKGAIPVKAKDGALPGQGGGAGHGGGGGGGGGPAKGSGSSYQWQGQGGDGGAPGAAGNGAAGLILIYY